MTAVESQARMGGYESFRVDEYDDGGDLLKRRRFSLKLEIKVIVLCWF